ncbi:IS110 family transposase [Leptospirillum ferriphilum]|uniref:IS110 family transposase n=1 Tax=Leptospirillum ferriphilum TaxID=178606 RepID=UPI0006B22C0B
MKITILGIDIAKAVFVLIGLDEKGNEILKKKLSRTQLKQTLMNLPPCKVAMESCGSSHYWGRQIEAMGHTVVLIPPQYVKPFVQTNKNDVNDARAICEAALRPSTPTVPVKTEAAQDIQSLHRARQLLVGSRTATINHLRGILLEYGILLGKSPKKVREEVNRLVEDPEAGLSPSLRETLRTMVSELSGLEEKLANFDSRINTLAKTHPVCKRLMTVPGVGALTATVLLAFVGDATRFRNGRHFAAYLGLVPRQHSSGGKNVLLGISKRGDTYLRTLLIHGGRTVVRSVMKIVASKQEPKGRNTWILSLYERRGYNRTAVAVANKNARILWILLTHEEAVYSATGPNARSAA